MGGGVYFGSAGVVEDISGHDICSILLLESGKNLGLNLKRDQLKQGGGLSSHDPERGDQRVVVRHARAGDKN